MGKHHKGMDRPEIHQVPERSGAQRIMEKTGSEFICGAPATPTVKGRVKVKITVRHFEST